MRKMLWLVLPVIVFILSCVSKISVPVIIEPVKKEISPPLISNDSINKDRFTEYITKTGKGLLVIEKYQVASLVNIIVVTKGFAISDDVLYFREKDPVVDIWQTDLDKDGFDELFIVTRSAGSGNNDKNITTVDIPALTKDAIMGEGTYMGHDTFQVEGIL